MTEQELHRYAVEVRQRAYAPYSHYAVGAVVETEDGTLFAGCNVENAAYPQCMCAERVAIFKAVSEGHRRIRRLLLVTQDGGTPCGGCRSVMAEFGSPEMDVIIATPEKIIKRYRLGDLLLDGFEFRRDAS
ncbi:MAG: cytidine deaminase [Ardenticatenia bacterium]|nr:MAG: cytidine deaminase [Ardenticatenia bacterium]